ncbi:GumC family protein [Flavobacterium sp. AG291]|uniref:GumC family protein n=1 Tax=Flavobacterium sp. AG291 TaxID=2184000 RepID=UPI000E0C4567|nr:tyrosine-protein kinase family protein [Flavobacterium sp. AG291]RDI11221.1 capsular exopolysaccharide synthesis family protein [Flavobacterium sp. AG291]
MEITKPKNTEFKTQVDRILDNWKAFSISLIICLALSFILSKIKNPVYFTETKIQLIEKDNGTELPVNSFLFKTSNINIENNVETIKSKRLLRKVADSLNLYTKYFVENETRNVEVWNIPFRIKPLTFNHTKEPITLEIRWTDSNIILSDGADEYNLTSRKNIVEIQGIKIEFARNIDCTYPLSKKTYIAVINSPDKTINELSQKIAVHAVGENSDILSITLKDNNIAKSKAVLNAMVDIFNKDIQDDKRIVLSKTLEFINSRLLYLGDEVTNVDNQKKEYKEDQLLSYLEADAGQYIDKKSRSEDLVFNTQTQIQLSAMLMEAARNNPSESLIPENIGLENIELNGLIAIYNKTLLKKAKTALTAGSSHPLIVAMDKEIETLRREIYVSIESYLKQLKVKLLQLKSNDRIQSEKVKKVPANEKRLREIERKQKTKEDLYLLLLQKKEEASISYAAVSPSVKIIDYAETTPQPIEPNKKIYLLSGFVLGLLLPTAYLKLKDLLETKIKSFTDPVFKHSGIPLLGYIPKLEEISAFNDKNDRSLSSELFRILITNINFLLDDNNQEAGSVILVTSSIAGEGKTFTSKNIAFAYASYDKKVLLIGADLRRPKIEEELGISYNGFGLSNYLNSKSLEADTLIKKDSTNFNNLDIIFPGVIPPNPSQLLSNGKFKDLVQELKKIYDYIIIDCPPTVYINDTFLISDLANLTIYLTRVGYTDTDIVQYSNDLAKDGKIKNMAYLLNYANKVNGVKYDTYYNGYQKTEKKQGFLMCWLSKIQQKKLRGKTWRQ